MPLRGLLRLPLRIDPQAWWAKPVNDAFSAFGSSILTEPMIGRFGNLLFVR